MKNIIKRSLGIFLAALFVLGAVSFFPINIKAGDVHTRTVMFYFVGSNLETESSFATESIKNILASNKNDNVNLIMITGGAKEWHTPSEYLSGADAIDPNYNQIWKLEGKPADAAFGKMTLLEEKGLPKTGEGRMSYPETMTEFIDYCYKNYPADSYDIFLWNHGGGPSLGFGQDEKDGSLMSVASIIRAFDESDFISDGNKFDLIAFDACLMANVEIILSVGAFGEYFLGSSEGLPGHGLEYKAYLNAMAEDVSISTFDRAKAVIRSTIDYYIAERRKPQQVTLAVFRTEEFAEKLIDDLLELEDILISEAKNVGNKNGRYNFYDEIYSLKNSIDYYDGERSLFDLGNLVGALSFPQSESDNLENRQIENFENAYTACALRILSKLADMEDNGDAFLGYYTSSMVMHSSLGGTRDRSGKIVRPDEETGLFDVRPSCISIFFGSEILTDDKWYLEDMSFLVDRLPEGKTKEFIIKNRIAASYYSMIALLGSTISDLIQRGEEDITYEKAKQYLDESNTRWKAYHGFVVDALIDSGDFETSDDVEAFFSKVFDQQLDEAVQKDKVTAKKIVGGDGETNTYQVTVKDSSAQAFMSIYSALKIKIATKENDEFVQIADSIYRDIDIDKLYPRGIFIEPTKIEGELKIADFYDDLSDTASDIYRRVYSSSTSTWKVSEPDTLCFVLYDDTGTPHLCDIHYRDASKEQAYIPISVKEGENSWSLHIYISMGEDGWEIVGTAGSIDSYGQKIYDSLSNEFFEGRYFTTAVRVTDAVYNYTANMPIGDFAKINTSKENWGITFGYEPISSLSGVESYSIGYFVEDIYDHTVEVTDAFLDADEAAERGDVATAIDEAEIEIENPVYTGKIQRPKVTVKVGDTALTEGVDFKVIYDGSYEKGPAYVAVMGIGDYVGTVFGEYTIECEKHSYVPMTSVYPTCSENGYNEYECTGCGLTYIEEKEATGHVLTYHAAKKATKSEDGTITYYSCERCGKYFLDAAGTKEIKPENTVHKYFAYVHDPRKNAKAMEDIVVDESSIYGFVPSESGSLKNYASYDWTDPELVEEARQDRIAYHKSLESMYEILETMRAEGKSTEEIARAVSAKRNEIRLAAYDGDPEGLAAVKARNLEKFGHEEGPLADEIYAQTGSWEKVIEKAFTANSGMDACLGLYDEYYDFYVSIGQVKEESPVLIIVIVVISVVAAAAVVTVIVVVTKKRRAVK